MNTVSRIAEVVAGLLLLALGVARIVEAVVLAWRGAPGTPDHPVSGATIAVAVFALVVVAALALLSGLGAVVRARGYAEVAVFAALMFVVGRAINGYLLGGAPTVEALALDGLWAAAILVLLWIARVRRPVEPRRGMRRRAA